jgi:hypothetical protein
MRPQFSPRRKGFYSGTAILALFTGGLFAFGIFASSDPLSVRLIRLAIAIVSFLAALQAFERRFHPQTAQARSRALSPSTLRTLRALRKTMLGICFLGFVLAAVMRLTGSQPTRDLAQDLLILSAVLLFSAECLADFCGAAFVPAPLRSLLP